MSPRRCCVPTCTATQADGVPMHRFPNPNNTQEMERFRIWIINIGGDIAGEDNLFIHRNRRVCHRHFLKIYTFPNHRLTSSAIPTLHLSGEVQANPLQQMPMIVDQPTVQPSLNIVHAASDESIVAVEAPLAVASTSRDSVKSVTLIKHVSRQQSPRQMSITERELGRNLAAAKAKLRKSQNTKNYFKMRLSLANKIIKTSAIDAIMNKMSPAAQAFFRMQISQFGKKPRGRRFTLDDKIWALSMYKPNPKAYKLLGNFCTLPKRKTLDKMLQKVQLLPGINDLLFYHLKKRIDKMPNHHKACIIIFDEMAITPHVGFDNTNDVIHGFVDNGTEREQKFCDHVLVFMVRGVIKKFKQPVAYTFCTGSTKTIDLVKQIRSVIEKVMATGLNVVATVCDQGTTNLASLNYLMKETKATYLRNNKNYRGGFFEIGGRKIYPIYDPPHVMKGIRNNLITKNLEYVMDGKNKIAKWAHLDALYRRGPTYRGVRLVHKLTAQHVIPSLIPKMRVKFCTQVFSENVGVTMGYMAGIGKLPKESKDTADLLLFFDKLFDSVNGNFSQPVKGKMYRCAVTRRSPHHKLWCKSLPILKSMKYVSKTGKKGVVPSLTSWIKTIEAFQEITKLLHSQGLNSLLLRHFNQDPLEIFFGSIRAHGLRNTMPSSMSFITSYKSLLLTNLTSPHSVGANCEDDESNCLNSLRFFLTENIAPPTRHPLQTIDEEHLYISQLDTNCLIANEKEKSAAIAYCSGWLVSVIKSKIYKQCKECRHDLESDSIEEFHNFIKIKEYRKDKTWLCYPTREVFDYFCQVENVVLKLLQSLCHISQILEYIETIVVINLSTSFLTCTQHKEMIAKYMVKKSILFFIKNWCKEINLILSGKTMLWDENDSIKQQAHNYYVKHKKK